MVCDAGRVEKGVLVPEIFQVGHGWSSQTFWVGSAHSVPPSSYVPVYHANFRYAWMYRGSSFLGLGRVKRYRFSVTTGAIQIRL